MDGLPAQRRHVVHVRRQRGGTSIASLLTSLRPHGHSTHHPPSPLLTADGGLIPYGIGSELTPCSRRAGQLQRLLSRSGPGESVAADVGPAIKRPPTHPLDMYETLYGDQDSDWRDLPLGLLPRSADEERKLMAKVREGERGAAERCKPGGSSWLKEHES